MWKSIDESEPVVVLRGRRAGARTGFRPPSLGLIALLLQRVIAWSAALAVHLVVAAICLAIYLDTRRDDDGLVSVSLHKGRGGEQGVVVEAPKPVVPAVPETKVEAKPEPVPEPVPEPLKPEPEPVPVPAPAAVPAPDVAPRPASIGGGASAAPTPTPPAAAAPEVTDKDVEKDPTAALAAKRAGDLATLQRGSEKDVVVVNGAYDHVELVLETLRIPHRIVEPERLPTLDLSQTKILLLNCHSTYAAYLFGDVDTRGIEKQIAALAPKVDDLEKRLRTTKDVRTLRTLQIEHLRMSSALHNARERLEALGMSNRLVTSLRRFVERGGYVFTSDWGLSLVEKAFPGWVKNGGNVGPRTVSIRPRAARSALMEGVFYAAGKTTTEKKFRWEIDSQSYAIKVENAKVETLVESADLTRYTAVAVAFAPEGEQGGKVLHILSHFKNQATRQGDYALQTLLLNFMLERAGKK